MDKANGWMALFRVVTPALLGVLIWIVTAGDTKRDRQMERIESKLEMMANDYSHQLVGIRERLASVEAQLKRQPR